MRNFYFHVPESTTEARALLREHGEDARLMAGGTALVNLMKQSLVFATHLVSLHRVSGLRDVTLKDGELHIGALVTHREMETSPLVKEHAPLLSEVYGKVATVRIRNVATVGGGVAHADPAQDPPAGLIVLRAQARLISERGERLLPVEYLFRDYYETAIEPDEILTELVVPAETRNARAVYLKYLPRTSDDYATVGVAAVARLEDGRCSDVRVALNAVAPVPVRARAVEDALEGRPAGDDLPRDAAELVREYLDPLDDFRGSAEYKRDMAVVFTRRALEQVLGLRL
jgi:carbon-monoxide dehydrogenase medium subunit